ncbi:hypothetical protein [Arcanobacterium hippocoleae]|uniref:rRNA biogenesis protein rrp5 n=1 Tax=Arcanobacterium hippocoleae TaxID=149017 RepID=A0ABU1T056_9ACTO|nr:hypothetical protein [Arcanobacterium hippocoleae]MDR6938674.1 hypothetical protein [Arcanobacterium hippocoleae]
MNVSDANYVIAALNQVAELVTGLAVDVERLAWEGFEDHAGMSGARPIAAAQLAQPALEEAVAEYGATHSQAPEPTPAPAPEPTPKPVSLEQVRGVLAALSSQGLTVKVRELIVAAGADRLSAVDPAKYSWLLEQAKGLADGDL